jgi:2-amino-4-hydroxy-6-hydroxymethyldihydropteridine diphosphokinase
VAEALLALGGNIGDARLTIGRAIALLCAGSKLGLRTRSSNYLTAPWGV